MLGKNLIELRTGRKLEVRDYGDDTGHPVLFFHGLIGSHHQASYISDQATRKGLHVIAPNRPGVGASEFVPRSSAGEAVADIEDLAKALKLDTFSVIGISGGTAYALATLHRLPHRVRTVTVISGMGPMRTSGALHGMDRRRWMILKVGSRYPRLAQHGFQKAANRFHADPDRFLDRLITTWSLADQNVFKRRAIYDLFMKDLHQVFTEGKGPESLSQELKIYGNYDFALGDLPVGTRVTLWQGLSDNIVPRAMAWSMAQALPNCEAHFVPGGHFMAVDSAGQIVDRLLQLIDEPRPPEDGHERPSRPG
jgi:pimeloyl-ACP methyl ester carboxylesterase